MKAFIRRVLLCLPLALPPGSPASAQADLTAQQRIDLDRVNTYLNQIEKAQAGFLQIAPDGAISRGNFLLNRPGRLRFEYFPPQDLLIVADGAWVAVKEGGQPAIQRYPISATPLSPLLQKHVDLSADAQIAAVRREGGLLRITMRDAKEPQKGEITLTFADRGGPADAIGPGVGLELRQWVVIDAQGLTTQIGLSDLRQAGSFDPGLFILNDPAPGSQNKR